MKHRSNRDLLWTVLCVSTVSVAANAQSNIDPDHKFAWGENIGWTNWQHDRPSLGDGVLVGATYLSGFIWGENVGWINVGDGTPGNGGHYGNTDGLDSGVNVDTNGDLFGLGWAENVGWVNFDTRDKGDQRARIDCNATRLRGYCWGENVGWINLDDDTHFVAGAFGLCPSCGVGGITFTMPGSPMTDAGQPHPIDDAATAQGYQVFLANGPEGSSDLRCWALTETNAGACGNFLSSVLEDPPMSGSYRITLDHPLQSASVTTITYSWGAGSSTGVFTALPGDGNGSGETNTADIGALIDCLTTGSCDVWECDIDRLGGCSGADLGRLIDLLNDAGQFSGWGGAVPASADCPPL